MRSRGSCASRGNDRTVEFRCGLDPALLLPPHLPPQFVDSRSNGKQSTTRKLSGTPDSKTRERELNICPQETRLAPLKSLRISRGQLRIIPTEMHSTDTGCVRREILERPNQPPLSVAVRDLRAIGDPSQRAKMETASHQSPHLICVWLTSTVVTSSRTSHLVSFPPPKYSAPCRLLHGLLERLADLQVGSERHGGRIC